MVAATIATIWALATIRTEPTSPSVVIGGQTLSVEVADTAVSRTQGLSGRDFLAENQGMLFVFDEAGIHCMWMRDMRFAIDMVWLNTRGKVVDIERNVTPGTYPATFCSNQDARYVLEVNAGVAELLDFEQGRRVELRL